TFAVERGLVQPRQEDVLRLDTPAGPVGAAYRMKGDRVEAVRITNVGAYLAAADVRVDCPGLGELALDIAYGGNFYAIVEPQPNYRDLEDLSAGDILSVSPVLRERLNQVVTVAHPEDPSINGVSHILWTGRPRTKGADGRNAVFYGARAIDRSPCGTGTSARM